VNGGVAFRARRASMAKRTHRRELKDPDEFLSLAQRSLTFIREHERNVTLAAVGALVILAIALGARWYRDRQAVEADAAFGAASRDFAAQKFDTAAKGFVRVASTWPNTASGRLALVYLADAYAELGKAQEAEQAYRQALERNREPLVRQLAEYNLGLLETRRNDAKSGTEHLSAASETEGPVRGAAWFARLSTGRQFSEPVGQGLQAIAELPPDAREYVEAQIAAQAKAK
jgi:predicted negative regulator of RcsB-dependent stress response